MNPKGAPKTKNSAKNGAKHRDNAVQKIQAKTGDRQAYDISLGEALQAVLRENA